MNKIKNERGELVFAVGSEGSPIRMLTKYPDQIKEQVEKGIYHKSEGGERPVVEFNGDFKDNLDFHKAVMFYINHPKIFVNSIK